MDYITIITTFLTTSKNTTNIKSQHWSTIREAVRSLAESLKRYAEYLDYQNRGIQLRHSQMELATDIYR